MLHLTVSIWCVSSWTSQPTIYKSYGELKDQNPNLRIAAGPNGTTYGIVSGTLVKIHEWVAHYDLYRGGQNVARERAKSLEEAKNAVEGQTVWFEQNKVGISYGVDSQGVAWRICENWIEDVRP